jgi:predicted small secreted protein
MVRLRALIAALVLAATALVSACNTAEGVGKDVSAAGHAVSRAADTVKDHL